MKKTVGVCGYVSTGSSAVVDLLEEFDDAQVVNGEFRFAYYPDGLEDLQFNLKSLHSSAVAIKRFRMFAKSVFPKNAEIDRITDDFLKKIVQNKWCGSSNFIDFYLNPIGVYIKKTFRKIRANKIFNEPTFDYDIEFSVMPENFDEAAKIFISDILSAMGVNNNSNEEKVLVLNQSFLARDPVKISSFTRIRLL